MAMTPAGLKAKIIQEIQALSDFPDNGQNPVVANDKGIEALAKAIVEYIQTNAVGTQPPDSDGDSEGPVTIT